MWAEFCAGFPEAAEVDDPLDAGGRTRAGKVRGQFAVLRGEFLAGLHRMHQEVCEVASTEPLRQPGFVIEVRLDDVDGRVAKPRPIVKLPW